MKQWSEIYKDDLTQYLKTAFIGRGVATFWEADMRDVIRGMLPEEHQDKIIVTTESGSLYASVKYNGVHMFTIGITRSRELQKQRWSYHQRAEFFYKDITLYMKNDTLSLQQLVERAIAEKQRQQDSKTEKLKVAKVVYDHIKEVLQTSSYTDVSGFLSFMKTNLHEIDEMS